MAFRQKQIKNHVVADLAGLTAATVDGTELLYVQDQNEWYTKTGATSKLVEASQTVDTIALLQAYAGSRTQLQVLDTQGAGMWFSYVTTGTHDGGIYFTATGKGSGFWKREIQGVKGINLSWFTDANLTTNVNVQLTKAVQFACNNTGVLYIDNGTYLVNNLSLSSSITNNLKFIGQNGTIKKENNSNGYIFQIYNPAINIEFEDLIFDGNRLNNLNSRDLYLDTKKIIFNNCILKGASGIAIFLTGQGVGKSSCDLIVEKCIFEDMGQHVNYPVVNSSFGNNTTGAVYAYTTGIVKLNNNKVINNTWNIPAESHRNPYGFLIDNLRADAPISNVEIKGNYFYGIGQASTVANGGNYVGSIYLYSGSRESVISDNIFENISYLAIGVYNSNNITVSNNKILSINYNVEIQISTGIIDVQTGVSSTLDYSNVNIFGNIIENFTSVTPNIYYGIKASSSNTAHLLKNVNITNNTIPSTGSLNGGILIGNIENANINENYILGQAASGIYIDNICKKANISKNIIIAATGNGIRANTGATTERTLNVESNSITANIPINLTNSFATVTYIKNTEIGASNNGFRGTGTLVLDNGVMAGDAGFGSAIIVKYNPQKYRGTGSPEGVVDGMAGDRYTDISNNNIYEKRTEILLNPAIKNTGWFLVSNNSTSVSEGSFTAIADVTATTSYTIPVTPNIPTGTDVSRYELYHNGIRLKRGVRWNYTSNTTTQVVLDVLATPAFPVITGDVLDIVIK